MLWSMWGSPRMTAAAPQEQNLLHMGKLRRVGRACWVSRGGGGISEPTKAAVQRDREARKWMGLKLSAACAREDPLPGGLAGNGEGGHSPCGVPMGQAENNTPASGILGQTEEILLVWRLGCAGSGAEPQPKGRAGV